MAYRLLGWRLGPRWETWARADLTSSGWLVRQLTALVLAFAPPVALLLILVPGAQPARLLAPLVLALVFSLFRRRSLRERALRLQGLTTTGLLPATPWWTDDRLRRRTNLVAATGTVVAVVGALAVLTFAGRH